MMIIKFIHVLKNYLIIQRLFKNNEFKIKNLKKFLKYLFIFIKKKRYLINFNIPNLHKKKKKRRGKFYI